MKSLLKAIKQHPLRSLLLFCIVVVASYFRLWELPQTVHFMGDQGRDALVVSRIFTDADLVFVGPVTSIGNMYLGPFYYYFMLPFLWLTYPSPLGPVYAVALVNIATIFLLYFWGRMLVGERGGLIAAGLMAFSTMSIALSRFSWNPNIVPFFSLAMVVATYQAWKKDPRYWSVVAVCFGILLQLHYVTLLAAAAAGVIWFWQLLSLKKDPARHKVLIKATIIGLGIWLLMLTPLFLFDMKHNWLNAHALGKIIFKEESFIRNDTTLIKTIKVDALNIVQRTKYIILDSSVVESKGFSPFIIVILLVIFLWQFRLSFKKKKLPRGPLVIGVYLTIGILGLSFYQHDVYDHYIAYLFPVVFLFLGFCLDKLFSLPKIGWLIVATILGWYGYANLKHLVFKSSGPSQTGLRLTASSIHQRVTPNEPYAIVLLSESKDLYGMNYRYFLSTDQSKRPVDPEHNNQADKLFIINEEQKTDTPQDLPIYEIVMFANKTPVEVYRLPQGISVTVLSKAGQP